MNTTGPPEDDQDLRRRAEALLQTQSGSSLTPTTDSLRVLHELQVHQIELELQNQELKAAQQATQEALEQLEKFNQRLEEEITLRTADLVTARDAAESSSRAKTMFLSMMSHELLTPMNAIIGITDLAMRNATTPKLQDYLGKIQIASNQLLDMINDVLTVSQLAGDRLSLADISFRLDSMLRSVNDAVSPQAARKGLDFSIEIRHSWHACHCVGIRCTCCRFC